MLLYFNALQHTWRIRRTVPSTNANEYSPWSKTKSHSGLHYQSSSEQCKMANQTQPFCRCLGGGELNILCSDNQNIAISNRLFLPCETLFVNWRKRRCLGLKVAAWARLPDTLRQSEGCSQGAALQGVVMGTEQVGHPPTPSSTQTLAMRWHKINGVQQH